MKKIVLIIAAAALVPMIASAQGTVNFSTTNPGAHRILQEDGTTAAPAGIAVELLWSPDGVVAYTNIASQVVTVNGFITTPNTATTPSGGGTMWFEVVATGDIGGTPYIGSTGPFQNATANPAGDPPPTPPNLTGWDAPIILTVVPEPTTFALAGLGAAALLIFRRRD